DGEESDGDESAELQSEFAESAGNDDDIPEMSAEPIGTGYKAWKSELLALTTDIERLGPINMLAVEEYAEESTRLEFLQTQRNDLTTARDDLQNAIKEINKTAKDLFAETF